ncbi:hypothetical protein RVS70_05565 [Virgibacillus sp. M23]|uniref:hypothetical protein n=1 Tax=Virgibacillus sp. M23 TaxID=3079030 RepID=UPI002A919384|nr:hypothetical protein [Virgibacillus sp. M23]MDY7043670.1 hypothetical protein [Virgibacillus sp. M23]
MLKYKNHDKSIKSVKSSIGELVDCGAFSICEDMSCKTEIDYRKLKKNDMFYVLFNETYINSSDFIKGFGAKVDVETLKGKLNLFTSIYLDDAIKLMDYPLDEYLIDGKKVSINRSKLFSVYAMILSRANIDLKNASKGCRVSFDTIDVISEYANVSESTVIRYINILYDIKLIFKITVSQNGKIKSQNVYSRWRDRHTLIMVLDKNKSVVSFNYYQLLKIGDTQLTDLEASYIIKEVEEEDGVNIDANWVDGKISKLFN